MSKSNDVLNTSDEVAYIPSWFIKLTVAVMLGGLITGLAWAVNLNATVQTNKYRLNNLEAQLDRIEAKLDALILKEFKRGTTQ